MYLLIRRLSLALAVIVVTATAATLPQPTRTILEQHDQTGVPGKEIVIGTAELPAETAIGFHTHPGDEIGYVLEGTLVVKTRGQPDKVLKGPPVRFV